MRHRVGVGLGLAALFGAGTATHAQAPEAAPTHRVFLADGRTLPSYGESVVVGDRLVFMLPVGGNGAPLELQLMSLSASAIDSDRTWRYTQSVRAAHYAATRGEADYATVTKDVSRILDELAAIEDPKRRLAMAEEARRRLFAWSEANYQYRAADVQALGGLFDEVIGALRAAAGESRFSVDLAKGPAAPKREPLLSSPSLRESIELALVAAGAADVLAERRSILRAALAAAAGAPGADDLRALVSGRLDEEAATDHAYATLASTLLQQADAAKRRGDVRALEALRRGAVDRDLELGSRRPLDVRTLLDQIDAKLEAVRAHRAKVNHYFAVRDVLARYERRVRPVLSAFNGLAPVLNPIRKMTGPNFGALAPADARLKQLAVALQRMTPPADARAVHATLTSALQMARQACDRRRQVAIVPNSSQARDASAAAAGAQLLVAQARRDLLALLRPPKGV